MQPWALQFDMLLLPDSTKSQVSSEPCWALFLITHTDDKTY